MIQRIGNLQDVTPQKINQVIDGINAINGMRVAAPLELTRSGGTIQLRLSEPITESADYYQELQGYGPGDGFDLYHIWVLPRGSTDPELPIPGPLVPLLPYSKAGFTLNTSQLTIPAGSGEVEVVGTLNLSHTFNPGSQFTPAFPNATFMGWRQYVLCVPYWVQGGPASQGGVGDITDPVYCGFGQTIPLLTPSNQTPRTNYPTPYKVIDQPYPVGDAVTDISFEGQTTFSGVAHTYFRLPNSNSDQLICWAILPVIYSMGFPAGNYLADYRVTASTNLRYRQVTPTESQAAPTPTTPWVTLVIGATPTSGSAPLTVGFNATATNAIGSVTYYWDLGATHSTSASPSATFSTAGFYPCSCTITDSSGRQAKANITIQVT